MWKDQIIRRSIETVLIVLLFVPQVYADGEKVLLDALSIIHNRLDNKDTVYVDDDSIMVCALLLSDLFDYQILHRDRFVYYIDSEEFRSFSDSITSNMSKAVALVDSIIRESFKPHNLCDLLDNKLNDRIAFIHYIDRSLDSHVVNFKLLSNYHLRSIRRWKKYKSKTQGDGIFIDCMSWLSGCSLDPHRPNVTPILFKEYSQWCKNHCEDKDVEAQFLDVFTISIVGIHEFLLNVNMVEYYIRDNRL